MTPEVIAAAKARYAELKTKGQTKGAFEALRDAAPTPGPVDEAAVVMGDTLPGGWYWHGIVRAGETLSLSPEGECFGVSLTCWSLVDPSERLNPPDTIKVQWTAAIGRGRVLLSDMGRVIASVTGGPEGSIDCVAGVSSPHSNTLKYRDEHLPAASVQFLRAAAKYGLSERDIGPAITLFAAVVAGEDGTLAWDERSARKGRFDLRAEMDLIAAVSNCPHPMNPESTFAPPPLAVTVWQDAPPTADDLCRTATPEAERAFINNAAMRAGAGQ